MKGFLGATTDPGYLQIDAIEFLATDGVPALDPVGVTLRSLLGFGARRYAGCDMKALKIIGLVIGFLVVSAGGAWAAFLTAPSEAEQCAHLGGLLEKKLPGFAASPPGHDFVKSCADKVKRGQLESQLGYTKRAKCVMAAESFDAVEACDTRKIRY